MLGLDVTRIGTVRALDERLALLEIKPTYRRGLDGLVPGARVQVLYWMHELAHVDRRALRVHPRGDVERPPRGVFSLRSPSRPNPIGVSVVDLIELRQSGPVVAGLDARDGSPLIDVKAACR